MPFLIASMFPDLFLTCVMKTFFSCLMLAIDLSPLNSSRISCTFSCFLDLLLSLIPCLIDLLADVSHLGLVFSVHVFSFFDEG